MATKTETDPKDPKLDHVKYIGPHPAVAVPDVDGEFVRGVPLGPLDGETIERLCKKKDEFKRCSAPQKGAKAMAAAATTTSPTTAASTISNSTTEGSTSNS